MILIVTNFGLILRMFRGVLAFFKHKASGRGYKTLINEALKRAIYQEELETSIRRVLREALTHEPR